MTGECPFTHLSMQLSSSTLCFTPSAYSQKKQTPTVDSAHVQRLIWIVGPWWRGMARQAEGARCHEACQRAFKELGPRKRKQMAAGITPLMDCTCSPRGPLPPLLFNQCPENPLGALKWKNVSMLGLSTQRQITRGPADSSALLPISLTHFHNQASTIHVYGCSWLCLPSTQHLTDNKQKRDRERVYGEMRKTVKTTNWRVLPCKKQKLLNPDIKVLRAKCLSTPKTEI